MNIWHPSTIHITWGYSYSWFYPGKKQLPLQTFRNNSFKNTPRYLMQQGALHYQPKQYALLKGNPSKCQSFCIVWSSNGWCKVTKSSSQQLACVTVLLEPSTGQNNSKRGASWSCDNTSVGNIYWSNFSFICIYIYTYSKYIIYIYYVYNTYII